MYAQHRANTEHVCVGRNRFRLNAGTSEKSEPFVIEIILFFFICETRLFIVNMVPMRQGLLAKRHHNVEITNALQKGLSKDARKQEINEHQQPMKRSKAEM